MAATPDKLLLTNSVSGRGILVTATASGSANTIHTGVSGASSMDEVWLYAYNSWTGSVQLTVLWGGVQQPNDEIIQQVPPKAGRYNIADGRLINGNLLIKAYADQANTVVVDGFVNRLT